MKLRDFISPSLVLLSFNVLEAADVLTQHNDNARTGATLDETVLNTTTVNSTRFGKLWTLYADGQVVAQPLYVSGVAIDTTGGPGTPVKGTFNAVIIATMHNTVYVYDADKENPGPEGRTVPLWARWLGPPRPGSKDIDIWSTNDPEWGIVSTPVVSRDKSTLYLVAWHDDGLQGLRYRLHALDMRNGQPRRPAITIGVSSNDPSQPCKKQSTFNPCFQKQRPALLLNDGILYVGFGGDGNRGALFAFDAQTLVERAFWSSTPTGEHGGIWQSGQGPAADAEGNVYVMTGNGTFDVNNNGQNYGNSFVRLKIEGDKLVVKDYFTPCNFQFLNGLDLDVGSGGPLLVPGNPARIVSGGKEGVLYVLNQSNMGKFLASPDAPNCQNKNAIQQVAAFPPVEHNGRTHHGNIHGSPVFWNGPDTGRIYAWGENSRLKAYRFTGGKLQDVDNPKQSQFLPPPGMPGGMLAVSANGRKAGTGIVWAVVPFNGDANEQRGVQGILLALNAQDVSRTLWSSEQVPQRDRLGLFPKFTNPVVSAGKVFVATFGDNEPLQRYRETRPTQFPKNYYVAVYGALSAPMPPVTIVNQSRDDVALVRAVTTPLTLDKSKCTPVDGGSIDCTDAIAQSSGARAFHRVLLSADTNASACSLLRVTTASKDTGLANSTGIGFYSAPITGGNLAAENSGLFVPKEQLKATGKGVLLSGAPATLHDFVGVANCAMPGAEAAGRIFKPYMQFGGADERVYRNWDVAENYRITPTVTQFDRSGDVLRK